MNTDGHRFGWWFAAGALLANCAVGEFIREWEVCGPFPASTLLASVVEREGAVSPASDVAGTPWKKLSSASDIVDLESGDAFGHRNNAVAFAYTEVAATAEGDLLLAIGSDDGVMVWWNGQPVLIHDVLRGTRPGDDKVHVRTRPGTNTLLLKIYDEGGGWGFCVERIVLNAEDR
jgi:hypothetical protein